MAKIILRNNTDDITHLRFSSTSRSEDDSVLEWFWNRFGKFLGVISVTEVSVLTDAVFEKSVTII